MLTITATTAATTSRTSSMRLFEGEWETEGESVTKISAHWPNLGVAFAVLLPNGSRLSCGRNRRWRKEVEAQRTRLAGAATQLFPTCERPAASSACQAETLWDCGLAMPRGIGADRKSVV